MDNVTLPLTGSGDATAIVATDEVGSAHYQYNKLAFGADGTATKVSSADPLPVTQSGVATSAKQDTAQTSLSSIDGKLPALGQALAAASVPVVLTAAQVSTLTPPAAITGFATEASISPATSANNQGSTVSIPASNTLALAAFAPRQGGTLFAPDANTATVYISLGGTATSSGIPLSPGSSMPLNQGSGAYAGAVNGLAASGTQALIVVEW